MEFPSLIQGTELKNTDEHEEPKPKARRPCQNNSDSKSSGSEDEEGEYVPEQEERKKTPKRTIEEGLHPLPEKSLTQFDVDLPAPVFERLIKHGFHLRKKIGAGAYGHVYAARDKVTGNAVAVKLVELRILPRGFVMKFVYRELKFIKTVPPHPYLIKFYHDHGLNRRAAVDAIKMLQYRASKSGVWEGTKMVQWDAESFGEDDPLTLDWQYQVMDYHPNGDLLDFLATRKSHLPEPLVNYWACQIIDALEHMQKHNWAHRDVKCENLLLDHDYNLKLIDFQFVYELRTHKGVKKGKGRGTKGSASKKKARKSQNADADLEYAHMTKTFCGSYLYASPELTAKCGYDAAKNDIWSFAVILYIMIYNTFPYGERHVPKLIQKCLAKVKKGKIMDSSGSQWEPHQYAIPLPSYPKVSPQVHDLLNRYLFVREANRISVGDMKNHEWFKMGWPEKMQQEASKYPTKIDYIKLAGPPQGGGGKSTSSASSSGGSSSSQIPRAVKSGASSPKPRRRGSGVQ